jgi:ATP-dependent DNA helicase RecQ
VPISTAPVAPARGSATLKDAQRVLRDVFGYDEFRPGQPEVIESVLAGRDTLAVMPTGVARACATRCRIAQSEGLTLVVSPLLALMKDQVDAMRAMGLRGGHKLDVLG